MCFVQWKDHFCQVSVSEIQIQGWWGQKKEGFTAKNGSFFGIGKWTIPEQGSILDIWPLYFDFIGHHTSFLALKLGRNDLCIVKNTLELNLVVVIEVLALKHHFIQNSEKMWFLARFGPYIGNLSMSLTVKYYWHLWSSTNWSLKLFRR